jgi:hypothetical protein
MFETLSDIVLQTLPSARDRACKHIKKKEPMIEIVYQDEDSMVFQILEINDSDELSKRVTPLMNVIMK